MLYIYKKKNVHTAALEGKFAFHCCMHSSDDFLFTCMQQNKPDAVIFVGICLDTLWRQ